MKRVKLFVILGVLAAFACACGNRLSEKKAVALLTDFYLYGDMPNELKSPLRDSVSLSLSLLAKHHVTQEQFEATIRYYAAHPKKMKDLYEQLDSLVKKQVAFYRQAVEDDEIARNQWLGNDTLAIDSIQIPENFSFHLPLDTIGNFTIRITARVFDDDSTQQAEMAGYFLTKIKKGMRDTVNRKTVLFQRSSSAQTYSLTFSTKDTNVNAFEGFWLSVKADTTLRRQHVALEKIRFFHNNDTTQYIYSDVRYPKVNAGRNPKDKPEKQKDKPEKPEKPLQKTLIRQDARTMQDRNRKNPFKPVDFLEKAISEPARKDTLKQQ
jgi:hypothetical protein